MGEKNTTFFYSAANRFCSSFNHLQREVTSLCTEQSFDHLSNPGMVAACRREN